MSSKASSMNYLVAIILFVMMARPVLCDFNIPPIIASMDMADVPNVTDNKGSYDDSAISTASSLRLILTLYKEKSMSSSLVSALSAISALDNVDKIETISEQARIYLVLVSNPEDIDRTIADIKMFDSIKSVEVDNVVTSHDFIARDNFFRAGYQWGVHKIRAPNAWTYTAGSTSVIVCVIDSGVNYKHPDLSANMWRNPGETGLDSNGKDKATNGVDDDGNGYVDDVHGINVLTNSGNPMDDYLHGSHVAGIVGAAINDYGMVGISPYVSIMACKFLNVNGSGFASDSIKCIEYALSKGASITVNSYGGTGSSEAVSEMLTMAQNAGQAFVASAGNNANEVPNFPASYPHDIVISVASTDESDAMSSFSSYGSSNVDLAAPGTFVLSTGLGSSYWYMSGTSMAAPHVAGALVLMKTWFPWLSAADAKRTLMNTGVELPSLVGKTVSGKRLDVGAAFESISRNPATVKSPMQFSYGATFDLLNTSLTITPGKDLGSYSTCVESAKWYPVKPKPAFESLLLGDDESKLISLGFDFPFEGKVYNQTYVNTNGFVTFGQPDTSKAPDVFSHFSVPRISALFSNLILDSNSSVSWKSANGKVVITWDKMRQAPLGNNLAYTSFQLSLSPSGVINIMYKAYGLNAYVIVGVSAGIRPNPLVPVDFSKSPKACSPPPKPCFSCQDDPEYLWKGMRGKDCEWVGKRPAANRCKTVEEVKSCPVTCKVCKSG